MESLQDRIIRHEGFCAFPKVDVPPMYVIGFGHDITKAQCDNYPNGILYADAEVLLEIDIAKVKKNTASEFPWILGLDECRQSVIYEMVYQLGIGGVNQFHHMISAIRDKDWETASQQMINSQWHSQTPTRCEELAGLMKNGYNEL